MSRSALKEVLLDLKSQMRSKRASSYTKKKDKDEPNKSPEDVESDPDRLDISLAKPKAPKEEDDDSVMAPKKPEKVDFAEEMAKFMKGKRSSKSDGVSMVRFGGEPHPVKAIEKKKGK